MMNKNHAMVGDLTLIKRIGKGAFGEVYLSKKAGRNEYFATKVMDRRLYDGNEKKKKYLEREIYILQYLNHPNILKIVDFKKTNESYYLVTEYINGGSLSDCLKKYQEKYNKPFTQEILQHLMRQIMDAVKYMHGFGIIHRDIKLDNIMVNFDTEYDIFNLNMLKARVKLIDFGLATQLQKGGLTYTALGSPINMDPYILKKYKLKDNKGGYDEKIDIWSLGTVCYEMLIGKVAFEANSINDLIQKVETGNYVLPTTVSKEVVGFINAMLQYDAQNRYTASELSRHPFLTKNVSQFTKIDTKRASNKIDRKGLNINIKQNSTIWSIFNEDDGVKLSTINEEGKNVNLANKRTSLPDNSHKLMNKDFYVNNNNSISKQNTFNDWNQRNYINSGNPNPFYKSNTFQNNVNTQQMQYPNLNQFSGMQQQNMNNFTNAYQPLSNNPYQAMNNNTMNYNNLNNTNNSQTNTIINNGTVYQNPNQNKKEYYRPMDNDDSEKDGGCFIM